MITKESNPHDFTKSKGLKIGDSELIILISGINWIAVFKNPKESFFKLFIFCVKAANVALSHFLTANIRIKHGPRVSGLFVGFLSLCFGIAFNSVHIPLLLSPFAAITIPFFPIWYNNGDLFRFLWHDVESNALKIYMLIFVVNVLVNTVLNWIGKGNSNYSKRGESLLFLLIRKLFKHSRINEYPVLLMETIMVFGIGSLLIYTKADYHFGIFLVIISINEMITLLYQRSHKIKELSIINA